MIVQVFKTERGWEVKIPSGKRASYIEDKKSIAVEKSRDLAERRKCDAIEVFKVNGDLQKTISLTDNEAKPKEVNKPKSKAKSKAKPKAKTKAKPKPKTNKKSNTANSKTGTSSSKPKTVKAGKVKSKKKRTQQAAEQVLETVEETDPKIEESNNLDSSELPSKAEYRIIKVAGYELPIVVFKQEYQEKLDDTHVGLRVRPSETIGKHQKEKYYLKEIHQPGDPGWPEGGYTTIYKESGYTLQRHFFYDELILHKEAKKIINKSKRKKRKRRTKKAAS